MDGEELCPEIHEYKTHPVRPESRLDESASLTFRPPFLWASLLYNAKTCQIACVHPYRPND